MKKPTISGFTFIRNGVDLCFPFEESIQSLLPLVEEFIVVVGQSSDETLDRIKKINNPKIRIIETVWNDAMIDRGFVYAQQKMIAQYACTSDWAFYLEGDEIIHENDISAIRQSVNKHHENPLVEALVFDYFHFYGNSSWIANSPAWYRRECRLIRNTIRSYAPDGQYWLVMSNHKKPRNPNAALANAYIYHYGWVRSNDAMQKKLDQVSRYWSNQTAPVIDYGNFDPKVLHAFQGTHPQVIKSWLEHFSEKNFRINPAYKLNSREKRHRILMKLEEIFNLDFSRKHFTIVVE